MNDTLDLLAGAVDSDAPTLPGMTDRLLLSPGHSLTLRPMRYPEFYERYKLAIANTWTVDEVDLSQDVAHLRSKLTPAEQHLIGRLVAFFATGDTIVAKNLVLTLYRHVNSPEARMYLGRQLAEEMTHVDFYLQLVDTYIPDDTERHEAFAAVENIPSIRMKAEFAEKWIGSMGEITMLRSPADRRLFLLNLTAFACGIEGLFFYSAFALVYFLRSKGLLPGLGDGTDWVFRDETQHMAFGMDIVRIARDEEPGLWDDDMTAQVTRMLEEAVECEAQFAADVLSEGVIGLGHTDMVEYLRYVADQRLADLGLPPRFNARQPFSFMELQGAATLTNFFERRVTDYRNDVTGNIDLTAAF